MALRECWLFALVAVIVLLLGSACAQEDEDFLDISPIVLSPGVPTDIFAPASNQWCNYTKISVPAGTAVTTVDFEENNGDAVYSLSPSVYPRSYRSSSASYSYLLGSDSAPHWVICAADAGSLSGCDVAMPSMYTHGADFYICVSRYSSPGQNISAQVTFQAIGVNGTFNNTNMQAGGDSVVVHYGAETTSTYHWTVFNVSLDWFVTKISGSTDSSTHYMMIPGIKSGSWWSSSNSLSFPAPGNHLVFLRSSNSFSGDATYTLSTEANCATGHGYYCLNLTSSIEFGTLVSGNLTENTGVVFNFTTPSALGPLTVIFDMGDTNLSGYNYRLFISGRSSNAHGQIPPYSWSQYESVSATGNTTIHLEPNREYFVALYTDSSTTYGYQLMINVSCPTCEHNGVCSATSAPYECSCPQGYGLDDCSGRKLTIQDGFGQLTGVPEIDNMVYFEFVAANYVGYLINISQFETANPTNEIYMYNFGVVDVDTRTLLFASNSYGTAAYSFFVPASSLVSQHKYIGYISQSGYSVNPRTINVTLSEFSNPPEEPSESGASAIAASISLFILVIAMALSVLSL